MDAISVDEQDLRPEALPRRAASTATADRPGLSATYDLLGVTVRVVVSDAPAAARVRNLLADAPRTRRAPQHVVRLASSGPDDPAKRTLYDGDRVIRADMGPSLAVAMLMWHLNQVAAATPHYVVVHAGCVAHGGRAILLPGPMEVGKSTLVTALVLHGFGYLSDEYAAVSLEDGMLHPYSRPIGLDPGSFPSFPHLRPKLEAEFEDSSRWHLRADDVRQGCRSDPVPPGAIVFPRYDTGARLQIEPVGRAEALCMMAEQALNLHLLRGPAFRRLGDLAATVPAYRLVFHNLSEACEAVQHLPLGA